MGGVRTAYGYFSGKDATLENRLKYLGKKTDQSDFFKCEKNENSAYGRELGDVSFEIRRYEGLDPYSISFNDYKNLNYESLEILFEKNSKEWKDALSLLNKVSTSDDDTINEIFFDKYKETKGEGEEWQKYQALMGAIATNNFSIMGGTKYSYKNAETLFDTFEEIKKDFKNPKNNYIHKSDAYQAMHDIKTEYEKRVAEKKMLLDELTKNTKPNILETKNI